MIGAEQFYIAINVIIGVACLVSIFLAIRYVPANGGRGMLILALVLLIISGAIMSFCQHIFRLYSVAHMADLSTGAEHFKEVDIFRNLLPLGNILEVVAIGLFALVARKMVSLGVAAQAEGGEK